MIEFKAECGHTVRARDEDGGGVVRCSYCGKPATVPEGSNDDLDFLFTDVDQASNDPKSSGRRWRKGKAAAKRKKPPGEFNPFAVVLRLCYGALLIIIIVVVGDRFIIPLFKDGGVTNRVSGTPAEDTSSDDLAQPTGKETHRPRRAAGWVKSTKPEVIYACSVPEGATIYCITAKDAPAEGRIHRERNSLACGDGVCKTRGKGPFVVEVAMNVQNGLLKHGPDYYEFRRQLRDATTQKQRDRAAQRYFIPDKGELFVDEDMGQTWIVRQFRDVESRKDRPTAVRALFLPRIRNADGRGFSVDALIRDEFIPRGKNYNFDDAGVRDELTKVYGVSEGDRDHVIEALHRIGVITCATPDGRTWHFSIGLQQGWLAGYEITDPAP